MRISILCSDPAHPVNGALERWIQANSGTHAIHLARRKAELRGGDLLFLISCSEIVAAEDRSGYRACLVLHASDLPRGRGWSPHLWQIIQGATEITVSLLEAEDRVDSGRIWKKIRVQVSDHALWNEINEQLFAIELELMDFAVREFDRVVPVEQSPEVEPSYYRKRTPEDSRIDPNETLAAQFDLLRTCDPARYPAYFDLRGHRYKLILEKMNDQFDPH